MRQPPGHLPPPAPDRRVQGIRGFGPGSRRTAHRRVVEISATRSSSALGAGASRTTAGAARARFLQARAQRIARGAIPQVDDPQITRVRVGESHQRSGTSAFSFLLPVDWRTGGRVRRVRLDRFGRGARRNAADLERETVAARRAGAGITSCGPRQRVTSTTRRGLPARPRAHPEPVRRRHRPQRRLPRRAEAATRTSRRGRRSNTIAVLTGRRRHFAAPRRRSRAPRPRFKRICLGSAERRPDIAAAERRRRGRR
jgi:hypothetical protein